MKFLRAAFLDHLRWLFLLFVINILSLQIRGKYCVNSYWPTKDLDFLEFLQILKNYLFIDINRSHCVKKCWNNKSFVARIFSYLDSLQRFWDTYTAWKVSKYGVFSGPYFPTFGLNRGTPYLSVFSPNPGKYGPEKISYLDTFHAVLWPRGRSGREKRDVMNIHRLAKVWDSLLEIQGIHIAYECTII